LITGKRGGRSVTSRERRWDRGSPTKVSGTCQGCHDDQSQEHQRGSTFLRGRRPGYVKNQGLLDQNGGPLPSGAGATGGKKQRDFGTPCMERKKSSLDVRRCRGGGGHRWALERHDTRGGGGQLCSWEEGQQRGGGERKGEAAGHTGEEQGDRTKWRVWEGPLWKPIYQKLGVKRSLFVTKLNRDELTSGRRLDKKMWVIDKKSPPPSGERYQGGGNKEL